ncbi:MAG: radical SAM peptide maturase, CXXX-repeat target family, partial [Lachnospiraceae bacterium]|nr:radical SAM peptide maturase, CXXX-repeat target family [Lachnospiraceae bacterium]
KYCYITHKASNKRMNFDTAKRFIDYILTADIRFAEEVIIEFFGGEPMIEMDLVDQISDYFKKRAYELNHPWSWRYRFNFATNGVNYGSPEVQAYIRKNYGKVSIGISIDGTREKHDLNRVFPDGSGSYAAIEKNIPLWISQFSPSTKMTFASADLKYLKDSVIDLWDHGVTDVAANVVFEDVWQEGDDLLLEQQLKELADYILDHQLFDKCYCTFFSDSIGGYMAEANRDNTYCGAGKMMALSPDGKIYPCVRYKDYSLNCHEERIVGTVDTGIDMELVRPFMASSSRYQDDAECAHCPIASGCPQCQGFSYDAADTSTNFQRAKYICKMQKARVRANEYYFAKLYNRFGIVREAAIDTPKMYFLLSDQFVTFCCYDNNAPGSDRVMTMEQIEDGLRYCRENFFTPVFVHGDSSFLDVNFADVFEDHIIQHILPAELQEKAVHIQHPMLVFSHETLAGCREHLDNCIYNIQQRDLTNLAADILRLFQTADRINVNVLNLNAHFDEECYLDQLRKIRDHLAEAIARGDTHKELNLLTDLCYTDAWCNCGAGDRTFAYAPDGKFYTCPAFYRSGPDWPVGTPAAGMDQLKNAHLYQREFHPICQACDAKQCRDCIYRNFSGTKEVNVPPSYQCRKSHLERKVAVELERAVASAMEFPNTLQDVDYLDPITVAPSVMGKEIGYYQVTK